MEGVFLTHGNTFLFNDCTDEFPVSNSDIYVSHSTDNMGIFISESN
jgi:hypothetical protein